MNKPQEMTLTNHMDMRVSTEDVISITRAKMKTALKTQLAELNAAKRKVVSKASHLEREIAALVSDETKAFERKTQDTIKDLVFPLIFTVNKFRVEISSSWSWHPSSKIPAKEEVNLSTTLTIINSDNNAVHNREKKIQPLSEYPSIYEKFEALIAVQDKIAHINTLIDDVQAKRSQISDIEEQARASLARQNLGKMEGGDDMVKELENNSQLTEFLAPGYSAADLI